MYLGSLDIPLSDHCLSKTCASGQSLDFATAPSKVASAETARSRGIPVAWGTQIQ